MPNRALISIGSYNFPEPSTYNATTATLVDSARNVQGKMIGTVIRDDVAKVEVSWPYLAAETWSQMLRKFDQASNGKFINNVTFFNQTTATWITRQLYVSDRTASAFRRNPTNGKIEWIDCQLSLIEV